MSAGEVGAGRGRPRTIGLGGRLSIPVQPRSVVVAGATLLVLVAAAVATLTLGRLGIPLAELPTALFGGASGKEAFVLERLRGPRLTVAVGTGLALGLAGALFQSVSRNPLGSPDVIGLGYGASSGAAVVGLLWPGVIPVPVGAVLGGAVAIAIVYLATGSGFRQPGRLIIAGVGVAAMAMAFTQYVVYVAVRDKASVLSAYINGSLSARSWDHALTIWLALVLLTPFALALSPRIGVTEMGDELADGLGANPKSARTWAIVLSVLLSSAAVSVAGPIAFIALTAPNIAKRLSASPGANLVLSALTGALLLVLADLVAQQLPVGDELPVGIYTMLIGGLYLGYLLTREWRKGVL